MNIVTYLKQKLQKKPKIIVVLGQTATGKSDIAVEIAKQYDAEIISADSRQVYTGMDLGSGKITKEEMQGIPHHMLDIIHPNDFFSAYEFQKTGKEIIKKILQKKKIPIICGGTGFYIDSLIYETNFSNIPPDEKFRKEMENIDTEILAQKFETEFPKEAKKIDLQNKIRVIRAFEICKAIGFIPKKTQTKKYNTLFIGLELEQEFLKKNIYKRMIKRLEQGMIEEVKSLYENGVSYQKLESFGLEYRHISFYLQNKITKEKMIDHLYRDIVKFAKRQKTWFKRNKNIYWFNPTIEKEKIMEIVKNFLK